MTYINRIISHNFIISYSLHTRIKQASVLFFALLALGCSSNKTKEPKINETLRTHIDEDNSKKFSYRLVIESAGRKSRGNGGGKPEGGGGRGGDRPPRSDSDSKRGKDGRQEEKILELVDANLTKMLMENGYCRDGYNVIDQEVREKAAVLNGVCIEAASEEDIQRFPNTKIEPTVIIEEDLGAIK